MKLWFDTEFIEDGSTIELLSIGIVAEDGREYYAENVGARLWRASPWVKQHVIPHLYTVESETLVFRDGSTGTTLLMDHTYPVVKEREQIADEIRSFAGDRPEWWGYYADYDWVVLCQLYGRMVDLPSGWPMFCMDVKQRAVDLGNPRLPDVGRLEHHALADARWTHQAWRFLDHRRAEEALAAMTAEAEDLGLYEG